MHHLRFKISVPEYCASQMNCVAAGLGKAPDQGEGDRHDHYR